MRRFILLPLVLAASWSGSCGEAQATPPKPNDPRAAHPFKVSKPGPIKVTPDQLCGGDQCGGGPGRGCTAHTLHAIEVWGNWEYVAQFHWCWSAGDRIVWDTTVGDPMPHSEQITNFIGANQAGISIQPYTYHYEYRMLAQEHTWQCWEPTCYWGHEHDWWPALTAFVESTGACHWALSDRYTGQVKVIGDCAGPGETIAWFIP